MGGSGGAAVAVADGAEGAIEMAFDGTDGEAGDGGDVGNLKAFDEAEEEDLALAAGEFGDRIPDESELLAGDQTGLGGASGLGDVGGDVGNIDGAGGGLLPEAEAVGAGVVAQEVERDAHQPGVDGGVAAEAGAGGPSAQEGVLGEGEGEVAIAERGKQEAKDARLVKGDDGLEIVEWSGDRRVELGGGFGGSGAADAGGIEGLFKH